MDQVKIGLFIRECRKAKNLTQEQLANKLYLTPKTISKWETGNGTPDVSVMNPLCEELDISLNELFIGEHISNESNKEEINEKFLIKLYNDEKKKNKRLTIAAYAIATIFVLYFLLCTLFASYVPMEDVVRILLIVSSFVLLLGAVVFISILDIQSSYYECPHCHERFSLSLKEYLLSPHTFTKRKVTCPSCKTTSWCARRITKKESKDK